MVICNTEFNTELKLCKFILFEKPVADQYDYLFCKHNFSGELKKKIEQGPSSPEKKKSYS